MRLGWDQDQAAARSCARSYGYLNAYPSIWIPEAPILKSQSHPTEGPSVIYDRHTIWCLGRQTQPLDEQRVGQKDTASLNDLTPRLD